MVLNLLVLPFHGHRSDFMLYNYGELGESPRPVDAIGVLPLHLVEPTFFARCPNKKGLWKGVVKEERLWGKECLFLSGSCFRLAK